MDALGVLDHLPATARLSINVPYELVTIGSDWEAISPHTSRNVRDFAARAPPAIQTEESSGPDVVERFSKLLRSDQVACVTPIGNTPSEGQFDRGIRFWVEAALVTVTVAQNLEDVLWRSGSDLNGLVHPELLRSTHRLAGGGCHGTFNLSLWTEEWGYGGDWLIFPRSGMAPSWPGLP
jgi:hypothetical protein